MLEHLNLFGGVAIGNYFASFSDRGRKTFQNFNSRLPIDASVCDANTLLQARWPLGWYLLVALIDI
jgi:hypothetical protein